MKPESHEYDGHRIEFRERDGNRELLIDKEQVGTANCPTGQYFLHDFAFAWSNDLTEVAGRFIKYQSTYPGSSEFLQRAMLSYKSRARMALILARDSALMRSSRRWAQAGWAGCIVPGTRGSTVPSRSK